MADFTDDMLGAWRDAAAAKSLDAGATWRIDLPHNMADAQHALREQNEALAQDQTAIAEAVARLRAFIDDYQPDAGAAKALEPSPEAVLREHLAQAGAQSKDLFDSLGDIRSEFNQFVQRVREFVSDFASIETTQAGVAIARTKVNWTGDVQTLWQADITRAQGDLHRQNVHVALARRGLLMRLMVVISTGAAKIVIRLATPGAQLLALPAIFQFIKDVIAEVRQFKATQA
jgi:hypothetical protein